MQINEPFVLRARIELPLEPSPSGEHCYDFVRQIWINVTTGMPVVTENDTKTSIEIW